MAFPKALPIPVRSGYKATQLSPQQRTVMDNSTSRVRRKLLSNALVMSLTWILTDKEKATFQGWVQFENNYGTNWVDIPAIGVPGTISCKLMDGNPAYAPQGVNMWVVSARFLYRRPKYNPGPAGADYAVWPTILPQPEAKGFKAAMVDPLAISDANKLALPQSRNRFQTKVTNYTCTIICTMEQRDAFNNFHYHTLIDGACWFMMFVHNSVDSLPTRVRIVDEPTESSYDGIFQIDFTLETNNARMMTRAQYQEIAGTCDIQFHNNYSDCYFADDYVE